MSLKSIGTLLTGLNEIAETSRLTEATLNSLKAATGSLSGAQIAAALSMSKLNEQQMIDVVTALGLDEAQKKAILSTLSLATAEGTATVATSGLTKTLQGLGAVIKAHPILAALSVAAVFLPLIVKGIDNLIHSAEKATEKMEESVSAFEEATSQLETLNNELETTKDRIEELNAKDSLTFVEESELQKLRESVELLQIQADLAKKERERKAEDTATDIITAYRKNFKHDISDNSVQEYMNYSTTSGNNAALFADESNVSAMLAGIEQMKRLRDGLDKSSENYQEDYQHFQRVIDDATDSIREQISVLSTYKGNLEAIPYDKLTDDQKAALNEIDAAIEFIYKTLDPAKWNEIQWGNIVSDEKYSSDVEKLNELAAQSKITADTIKEQFPALAQACADAGIAVEDVVDNVNASFERTADSDGLSKYTAKLEELPDLLSDLKSSYSALESAQEDMANGGGLSVDTIEALAKAEENYLDYLYEENGVIKLNTEAWEENANAKMQGQIDEIEKEIDSLIERNSELEKANRLLEIQRSLLTAASLAPGTDHADEIKELTDQIEANTEEINANTAAIESNQSKLGIYSSLFGSITGDLDAYTSALNNFSNIASSIDSVTSSFQTLADLQAEVANGFTMSLDKALEFAEEYPEILNSATLAADGQITLNEGVVNSFIEGKKAETDAHIDSLIAQLEGDKAKLQARMEFAQAELDMAKAVGDGEGQITKELTEYRLNTANQLLVALIDAGVDEATAFQMAAAAMAGNAQEFDRIATEVCTDVNGNFNSAAYAAAQAIYQNMESAKRDVASLAAQAQQTAAAIAGIAAGAQLGSSAIVAGSGGGSYGSQININLSGANFQGTDFSYDAKEIGLDDFISDLELDISNYQSAIAQIDGQIAALQALKNTPLKSFQSGKGSGGSGGSGGGSGGSSKEIEEYIVDIDKYRKAVQ